MSDVDLLNPPFKLPVSTGGVFDPDDKPTQWIWSARMPETQSGQPIAKKVNPAHAAYIVAAVNAAPGLAAEVARLREENARLAVMCGAVSVDRRDVIDPAS